jgi:hypothetical protein
VNATPRISAIGFNARQDDRARIIASETVRITAMIERRQHPRHRVLKRGVLTFIGGGGIDCTVRNLSLSGARVDVASPVGIPAQFHLVIETDQFIRRGRPVWSNERQIGIEFE